MKAPTFPTLEMIPIEAILPSRPKEEQSLACRKYPPIRTSMREIGLIEPLLVWPIPDRKPQQYMLIDGHLRLAALKTMNQLEALCLLTQNPENFTGDFTVCPISPIQEHHMILHAVTRGVSEARIAHMLHVDVQKIREKRSLLDGICAEAVHALAEKDISEPALRLLRKVNAARQTYIAGKMNALGNYTINFVRALIAATPAEQRVLSKAEKLKATIDPGDLAGLERELETLHRQIAQHGSTYGDSFTKLTQIRGYLNRLLDNPRVLRYLLAHFPDHLRGFQKIIEFTALDDSAVAFDAESVVSAS